MLDVFVFGKTSNLWPQPPLPSAYWYMHVEQSDRELAPGTLIIFECSVNKRKITPNKSASEANDKAIWLDLLQTCCAEVALVLAAVATLS